MSTPSQPIRFEDDRFLEGPALRWSLSHLSELAATIRVGRGAAAPVPFPTGGSEVQHEIDALAFTDLEGRPRRWRESLQETCSDAILVLHRGRCVYESYPGALRSDGLHACFSVTKSYVATLAAVLVHEGTLDERRSIGHYLPAVAGSAFADATLRQVMDMQVGIAYEENYADPHTDFWSYARAAGLRPRGPDNRGPPGVHEFLRLLRKNGDHGSAFAYKTVNTDVLSWVMTEVCREPLDQLLSRRLWSRIGCEQDARLIVDPTGIAMAGAGLNACLRDLARFGELMRCEGSWQSTQVIPAAVVADIRRGSDRGRFAAAGYALLSGYSYRSMWWITHNEIGAFEARGIHGQRLYISPQAQLVIARFGSHPVAANAANDPLTMPAFLALARHLS
jgi:CubicO group peptidase (beta-lactamase class C family)